MTRINGVVVSRPTLILLIPELTAGTRSIRYVNQKGQASNHVHGTEQASAIRQGNGQRVGKYHMAAILKHLILK